MLCCVVGAAITVLFTPNSRTSLESTAVTKSFLVLHILDNVQSKFSFWHYELGTQGNNGTWAFRGAEEKATVRGVSIVSVDQHDSDLVWITTHSFTQPSTLLIVDANKGVDALQAAQAEMRRVKDSESNVQQQQQQQQQLEYIVKQLSPQYNAAGLVEYQVRHTMHSLLLLLLL